MKQLVNADDMFYLCDWIERMATMELVDTLGDTPLPAGCAEVFAARQLMIDAAAALRGAGAQLAKAEERLPRPAGMK